MTKITGLLAVSVCVIGILPRAYAQGEFDAVKSEIIDSTTGRTITCININNQNTPRAYFTQNMWASDSERFVIANNGDGYLYEYALPTNKLKKLPIKSGADFCISPNNFLYYINKNLKTIDRYHLDSEDTEAIANYPSNVNTPSSIQVTHDDSKVTVVWAEPGSNPLDYELNESGVSILRNRRIPILDTITKQWDLRYTHEFPAPYPHVTHTIINPVYPNLVFFCHEGTTENIPDRLWTLDTDTGEKQNVFKQHYNNSGKTGETSGHESWSYDGESLVFVKYLRGTNLGQSGIVRVSKEGDEREYINSDYTYWHCQPANDNRFIVADTQESIYDDPAFPNFKVGPANIVVIDSKTSKSYLVARVKIGGLHPWQPHATFSPDGKYVTFSMIDENNVLSVGIVDVSDITQTGEGAEIIPRDVNNNKGFVSTAVETNGELMQTIITANRDRSLSFISANYNEDGSLHDVSISSNPPYRGEYVLINRLDDAVNKTPKHFLWNAIDDLTPHSLHPTQPLRLRMVKNSSDAIRLSWALPKNLGSVAGYHVYRNGEQIGTVRDTYFRDTMLSKSTTYEYAVRAFLADGYLSPPASGRFSTLGDTYSTLDDPLDQQNMQFVVNTTNPAGDSYTEKAFYGSETDKRNCYKSTTQPQDGGGTKTGKFYFRVDKNYITPSDRNITFIVTYFDEGTTDLRVQYNSTTNIATNQLIVRRTNTRTWMTAQVTVNDASFVAAPALTNSDFRIEGGSDTYLYKVQVIKEGTQGNTYQVVTADLANVNEFDGLEIYMTDTGDGATTAGLSPDGTTYRTANSFFYFSVDDDYMYGKSDNEATITFSYLDSGTGDLILQYNSSDSTMTAEDSNYKELIIGKKGDTGKFRAISVKIIDANFTNAQDSPFNSDFRLKATDGLSIEHIKVLNKV